METGENRPLCLLVIRRRGRFAVLGHIANNSATWSTRVGAVPNLATSSRCSARGRGCPARSYGGAIAWEIHLIGQGKLTKAVAIAHQGALGITEDPAAVRRLGLRRVIVHFSDRAGDPVLGSSAKVMRLRA